MDETTVYYVDVLLPLHIPGCYTYRVPQEYNGMVAVGQRVVVQFGRQRLYSAVVRRVHSEQPSWKAKYVLSLLDEKPVVTEQQMEFWEWLASYYMCYIGDVMAVALPAGMKLASESSVSIHPDYDGELSSLTKYERQVVQLLSDHPVMKVEDIGTALGIQKVMPLIRTMIERSIIVMDEDIRERFKPKTSTYLKLGKGYESEGEIKVLFDDLERKKRTKQVELMMQFLKLSSFGKNPIAKRLVPQGSALQTLLKNGVLVSEERVENGELKKLDVESRVDEIVLNEGQRIAYDFLSCSKHNVNLLHGVTSSGKTEVYIKLINDVVKAGHQALLMLPEIALTTQVINRIKRYFGDKVGVYHSRFSASQRVDVWRRTMGGGESQFKVILGTRSALLLPFSDLGLIIIDEEHDASYKQQDPAPRYQARDAAIYLAKQCGARVVLGSATPSVESYHNAVTGKYGLVEMMKRYGGYSLPETTIVDMRKASKDKEVHGHFSKTMLDAIEDALHDDKQVILFQNRRGFALHIECDDCHNVPQCVHCDVSLVYHKATNSMRCHYCGYSIPVPHECPACHSTHLRMVGIGTERVEEDLQILFPDAKVGRMDLDSTLQKNQYLELMNDFENRRLDILVGTQMVTKGLDFQHVSVVGIVNADGIVNYPNFRSYERAYQQLTQVSGRAGRHGAGGKVIIQTYNPHHEVIVKVVEGDYKGLFEEQINERRVFRYPPYFRLIEITLRHRDAEVLGAAAEWLAEQLRTVFGNRVIGPEYPLVSRVRALYIKKITLRFERSEAIGDAKRVMMLMADDLTKKEGWSGVSVHFDVDPY
ncbi:MAG: primosomal protein N' [Bacteroidales bacterium]|nr:primosomal protein N' [Bacteroidales bacterium]